MQDDGQEIMEEQLLLKIFKSISSPMGKKILFCEDNYQLVAAVKKRYPSLGVMVWDKDNRKDEQYDYIYVGRLLEKACIQDELAVNIRKLLRKNGQAWYLIGNIHHGDILRQITADHWHGTSEVVQKVFAKDICSHYTRQDVTALLARSGYENIWVDLIAKDISEEQRKYFRCHGINFADEEFNAVYWFIKASRFDEAGVELRAQYTELVRQDLVKYLRRIENGIETRDNIKHLWALCENEGITFEYLQAFMQHSLLEYEQTLQVLAASLQEE